MTSATETKAVTKEATKIETVTLTDGRIVDFAGKRKLLKTSKVVDGKVIVQLDFRNGETRDFTIPDALLLKFAAHGAEQKLGDEIAGLDEVDDAVLAIDELVDRLYNGNWGVERQSNGMAGTSVLMQALVKQSGKSAEQIKAFLSTKTQAEKTALRNNPKIKPFVEEIEAAKASKGAKIDTDALLGELSD